MIIQPFEISNYHFIIIYSANNRKNGQEEWSVTHIFRVAQAKIDPIFPKSLG